MTVQMFDAGQRAAAAQYGRPMPRLAASPLPPVGPSVAVRCWRTRGGAVSVEALAAGGQLRSGAGESAARAVASSVRDAVGSAPIAAQPVTALVADNRSVGLLGTVVETARRATDGDVRLGAAVAGWWTERAAHPGTLAVIDLVSASDTKYAIGVAPDEESESTWRRWLRIDDPGLAGLHAWRAALDVGDRLAGVASVQADDTWLWEHTMNEVAQGRSWSTQERLGLAALRLRTRCDAADLWESALLSDKYWRRRAVYTGHVCTGMVVIGTAETAGRFTVVTDRLDTRLKAGAAIVGWPGLPTDSRDTEFHGEIVSVRIDSASRLALSVSARRRGYQPPAGDVVTVMPEPTNSAVQFAARTAIRTRYRQSSWIGQEATPVPQRREVPLDVLVAAADDEGAEQ